MAAPAKAARRRPKLYCVQFGAGSAESAMVRAVEGYGEFREERPKRPRKMPPRGGPPRDGMPDLSAGQRGTHWEIDAPRRLLVFWSAASLAQTAASVEAVVVAQLRRFCAVDGPEGARVRVPQTADGLTFPQNGSSSCFAHWFAEAGLAADRENATGSAETAAEPVAGVDLTPSLEGVSAVPGARVRLTLRSVHGSAGKRSLSQAASSDAGAVAYSGDRMLALVVHAVAQENRAAGPRAGKVRCWVSTSAAGTLLAGGNFLAAADVASISVSPRDSDAAARVRALVRLVRLHVGPCEGARSEAAAARLLELLRAASKGLDPLDWAGMLRQDKSNQLYQKKTELFAGVRRALRGGSACAECRALLAGPGRSAYEAYRAWHDLGESGPPMAWADVPAVVVCDAWVHHAGGRTPEVLSRYEAAVRETWPELSADGAGLCVLVSSDFRFQRGAKYPQQVRDAFVAAGGAAGEHVFTVPDVLRCAKPRANATTADAAWAAGAWVVLTEGVPTWQLSRLVDQLRTRPGPGRVVMTHCHETGAFATADGGWDIFAELRSFGGCRYRYSRRRLSEADLSRLQVSESPEAAACDVSWSVGLPAKPPTALAVGALVLACGASRRTNMASEDQRLPCRVQAVAGGGAAAGAQVVYLTNRVPSRRRSAASGERPLDSRGGSGGRFFYRPRGGCGAAAAVVPADGQPPSRSDGIGRKAAHRTAALSFGAVGWRRRFNEAAAALRQTAGAVHVSPETALYLQQQVPKLAAASRSAEPRHAAALC